LVICALLLAGTLVPATVVAQPGGGRITVSGCIFQLDNQTGERTPVGPNLIAERPVTMAMFPCPDDPTANGFLSFEVNVQERVMRIWRQGDPFFTSHSTQTFTGLLFVDGVPYECTVNQTLSIKGPLNPNLAINDPAQGAQSLSGTWAITGGSACGDQKVRGNGTLEWTGFPNLPTYEGQITLH
jgi:hypothetical protein